MGAFCNCPEELMVEIVLRLPAESVLRFKSVCKWWYALINDSAFKTKHLHYSNTKISLSSSTSLLHYGRQSRAPSVISSLTIHNNYHHHHHHHLNCVVDEEFNLPPSCRVLKFVGSHCNGIFNVALQNYQGIILWNPTIKEVKLLPDPYPTNILSVDEVGFGYDSKANEYKVVRIMKRHEFNHDYNAHGYKAEIYTLSNDCWREIEIENVQIQVYWFTRQQVYCKGVYYWFVISSLQSDSTCKDILLWFDMCDEKFGTIELPVSVNDGKSKFKLMLWNDTVAFLVCNKTTTNYKDVYVVIEMWVLVDGCSWTKLGTIGPIHELTRVISFWNSDQLLFEYVRGQFGSYNLHTKRIRNISFAVPSRMQYRICLPYVQSLVSLKRGNKLDHISTFGACLNFLDEARSKFYRLC